MLNVNKITSQLSLMPDTALQQFAQMNKADPYMLALAVSESNRRKETRSAAQAQAAPVNPPKVADQAVAEMSPAPAPQPEMSGIAQIPAENMQGMAAGGIVAFADGGAADEIPRDYLPEDFPYDPVIPVSETERNLTNLMLAAPGVGPARGAGALMRMAPYAGMLTAADQRRPTDAKPQRKGESKEAARAGRTGISQLTPQQIESYVRTAPEEAVPPPPVAGLGFQAKRSRTGLGGVPSMKVEPVPPTKVPSFEEMQAAARRGAEGPNKDTDAAYAKMMEPLTAEAQRLEGKDNLKEALIRAGLGMMASKSPYALQGIGEGAIQGFDVYQAANKADAEARAANTRAQITLQQAQRAERSGNMRDATSLYGRYQEAEQAARGHDLRAQELKSTEAYRRAELELRNKEIDQRGEYYRLMGGARGNPTLATLKAQLSAVEKELTDKTLAVMDPARFAELQRERETIKAELARLPGAATMQAAPSASDPLGIR